MGEIFAKYIWIRDLCLKYIRNYYNPTEKKTNNSIKKLGNYLNGHFSKEGLKMSNNRMEEAQHH